eukprot:1999486-Prymnesium_polylepis.1
MRPSRSLRPMRRAVPPVLQRSAGGSVASARWPRRRPGGQGHGCPRIAEYRWRESGSSHVPALSVRSDGSGTGVGLTRGVHTVLCGFADRCYDIYSLRFTTCNMHMYM